MYPVAPGALTSGIVIDNQKQLHLYGEGGIATLDREGRGRHFKVATGALILHSIALVNGRQDDIGGAIRVEINAVCILVGCTIANNTLDDDWGSNNVFGGGVYVDGNVNTRFVANDTTFANNTVRAYSNKKAYGGGLFFHDGEFRLTNCLIDSCLCTTIGNGRPFGGGLCMRDVHYMSYVTGCTFVGCSAITEGGNRGQGGGIYMWRSAQLTISGTTITRCSADNAAGGIAMISGLLYLQVAECARACALSRVVG